MELLTSTVTSTARPGRAAGHCRSAAMRASWSEITSFASSVGLRQSPWRPDLDDPKLWLADYPSCETYEVAGSAHVEGESVRPSAGWVRWSIGRQMRPASRGDYTRD